MVSVAIDKDKNDQGKVPFEGNTQPYPIFVSTLKCSDDLAYGLTKAVMDNYESIKDAGPSMGGYQIARQNFTWVFSYHPGSIKYYEEKGVWTYEHAADNEKMKKRQALLGSTWKAYMAANGFKLDEEFNQGWKTVRFASLDALDYRHHLKPGNKSVLTSDQ